MWDSSGVRAAEAATERARSEWVVLTLTVPRLAIIDEGPPAWRDEASMTSSWRWLVEGVSACGGDERREQICVGEASMGEASTAAQARWELENNIQTVEDVDALFKYNVADMQAVQQQKPWSKDPHFFKQ
jgi:hypothetical protein